MELKIGTRVRITHKPEHDGEYVREAWPLRAAANGKSGKIVDRDVEAWVIPDGETRGAWFDPDELTPIDVAPEPRPSKGHEEAAPSANHAPTDLLHRIVAEVDRLEAAHDGGHAVDFAPLRAMLKDVSEAPAQTEDVAFGYLRAVAKDVDKVLVAAEIAATNAGVDPALPRASSPSPDPTRAQTASRR